MSSVRDDSQPAGKHCLIDFFDCGTLLIDDLTWVEICVREAAELAGATVITVSSHRFAPQGVTAVALLKESHLSIHTWPERKFVAVDLFSCGQSTNCDSACSYLFERFEAKRFEIQEILRG